MINQVIIDNNYGESLTIKLPQTEPTHGLFITEIEGLGPVKANINMRETATRSGATYISSRAESRDIIFHVLYLGNNDGVSAEDARLTTYKFFPLGEKITLTFYTENRIARTTGYVESNEPDIFSDEVAGASITVSCPSSWFTLVSPNKTIDYTFGNLYDNFEFEFEDPVSALPTGSIIFSSIEHDKVHEIYYEGEAEVGARFSFICKDDGAAANPILYYDNDPNKFIKINTDVLGTNTIVIRENGQEITVLYKFGFGDRIDVNTTTSNKYVKYTNGQTGETIDILRALDPDSTWLKIHPGKNTFSYTCVDVYHADLEMDVNIHATVYVQGV